MLEIKNLSVAVEGKEILHGINMTIGTGETHVLFGPNGSGKTTLLMTIMGFEKYQVAGGNIFFDGADITGMTTDERARLGIGISFQRPPVIRGVRTRDMVAACLRERSDEIIIAALADEAELTDFLDRDTNYGFSGGEIKRSELMQLRAQNPALVLLDEPESGVDLVNIALIGRLINGLLEKDRPIHQRKCMGLIITHTGHILEYVNARTGYVMCEGRLSCEGGPRDLLNEIKEKGYQECITCQLRRSLSNA